MRLRKYLLVPWLAVTVYALSSLFVGSAGLKPYQKLLAERDKVYENLEELERLNQELEGTMDALRYDSETVRVRAREMGYGGDNEHFVRIVGLPAVRYREIKPGAVQKAVRPEAVPDTPLRIVAGVAGLILFLLFLAKDMLDDDSRNIRPYPPFPGSPAQG
jgi:cell division protein FtsB